MTAVLVTLGCGGQRAPGTDGGRDIPSNTQFDTAETPVDTVNATPTDVGVETPSRDVDASAEENKPVDVGADSNHQVSDASSDALSSADATDGCALDPNGTRFVDHALGTDDHTHGNGPGRCAFRTLTYALGQASDQISLSAQDTYQGGVAGETLPFLLTGNQNLLCNGATLTYDLGQSTYDGIVDFAGTRNGMTGCHVDGQNLGGYCLVVNATAAEVTRPHVVTGSTVTGCGNVAIIVPNSFNNVIISSNTFTLDATTVYIRGSHTNVRIVNNIFVGNRADIQCDDTEPGVSGSGNVSDGGDVICSGCGGCPFGP
jgi:hypothetical protein